MFKHQNLCLLLENSGLNSNLNVKIRKLDARKLSKNPPSAFINHENGTNRIPACTANVYHSKLSKMLYQ